MSRTTTTRFSTVVEAPLFEGEDLRIKTCVTGRIINTPPSYIDPPDLEVDIASRALSDGYSDEEMRDLVKEALLVCVTRTLRLGGMKPQDLNHVREKLPSTEDLLLLPTLSPIQIQILLDLLIHTIDDGIFADRILEKYRANELGDDDGD